MIGFLIFYWLFSVLFLEGFVTDSEMNKDWMVHVMFVFCGGLIFPIFLGALVMRIFGKR